MTEDTRQETIERGTDEAQRADFDGQEKQTSQAGDIFDSSLERVDWALDTVRKNKEKVPDDRSKSVLETAEERLLKARERLINTREKVKPLIPEEEKEEINKALEILERGPANHNEIVEMVNGLSYEQRRQQELIAKYGKSCLARCKAFFAGELDSYLLSGVNAKQDKAESTKFGRFSRRAFISMFNRKNMYAAGTAIAVGVLTGGIGGVAAGVVVGGILGRGVGEAWESIKGEEKSARGILLEKEREYWAYLQNLANEYKNAPGEERSAKLQILVDEFNKNSNSAVITAMTKANEDLLTTIKRWDRTRSICQTAGGLMGGVLGFGINAFGMHSFSGIDIDYQLHNKLGQQAFHNVRNIDGVWKFAYKTGEAMSHPGNIVDGSYWHVVGESTARIYTAAATKAAPTIAAFLLANLGRNKKDPEPLDRFRNQTQVESIQSQTQTEPESRAQEPISREEGIATAREKIARVGRTPEGVITRDETPDTNQDDWSLSRRAAMIILARLNNYADDLNAKSEVEGLELFKQKAKEILSKEKEITVHCTDYNPKKSDLDGETAIKLLELALGHRIVVNYKPQGEFNENNINIDTGMKDYYHTTKGEGNDLFSGTVFIDHHGLESKSDTSAAKLVYEALVSYGLLETSDRLDKLVEFVTHFDNMTGKYKDDKDYEKSPHTVLGLHGAMGAYKLFNFFLKNPDPDYLRNLTEEELKLYGLKGKRKKEGKLVDVDKPKELEEKRKEALDLLGKLPIVETPYGKVVVDKEGKLPKEAFASSKYDIHVKGFKSGGFLISNVPMDIHFDDGQRIRNMWICKDKPENGTTIESIVNALKAAKLMPKAA